MFRWPEIRLRGSLCAWEGSPGADSHGDNSSGMSDAGAGSGGGGSTPGESYADALAAGYTAPEAPAPSALDTVLGWLGIDTTKPGEEIAAKAFVDVVQAAIPGAGLLSLGVDAARRAGLDVQDAAPPDNSQTGNQSDPCSLSGACAKAPGVGYSPYGLTVLSPAAAPGAPGQPDPDFPYLPVGNAAGGVLGPSAGALDALEKAKQGATAETSPDAGVPSWAPLAGLAALAASLAFG